MDLRFKIDTALCTSCGLCSAECPSLIIDGSKGIPFIKDGKEGNCIRCQHCLAICPTSALSIHGKDPKDSMLVSKEIPQAASMERLIKTRRSVRKFVERTLDKDVIDELLQTSAYAPSGHNKNQVLFTVSYTEEEMAKVRELVYGAIKKANEKGNIKGNDRIYNSFQHLWETKNIDVLFRKAPHIIIASVPRSNANAIADGVISLSYFELYANTHGIATLWNGFVKYIFDSIAPDLQTELRIPEDHVISYLLVFGKPAVKFKRAVQSEGLHVNRIDII